MADEPVPTTPAPTPTPPPEPQRVAPPQPDAAVFTRPEDEAGRRALRAEREARHVAEQAAQEAARRTSELSDQLAEANRRAQEVESLRTRMDAADQRTRRANLGLALVGQGIMGPQANAVADLLHGVEYDDAQRPTNLDAAIEAAKAIYPPELFAAAQAPEPDPEPTNGQRPNLHNGPRPTVAGADEDENFAAAMRTFFPGQVPTS